MKAGCRSGAAWGLRVLRVSYALIRDLREGQLTLRAMSLVYTTILSLVPLMAISFSILKGFGVHNQVEPVLLNLLAPLGDKGVEISERIVGFMDNVKVGVLGSLGFVLLFYTVVSLMQKIERAFNYVWQIKTERPGRRGRYRAPPPSDPDVRVLTHPVPHMTGSLRWPR